MVRAFLGLITLIVGEIGFGYISIYSLSNLMPSINSTANLYPIGLGWVYTGPVHIAAINGDSGLSDVGELYISNMPLLT